MGAGSLRGYCTPLIVLILDLALAAMCVNVNPTTVKPVPVDLAKDILQGLGISRIPDVTKANVSQEEWATMTQLYLERVAARQGERPDQALKLYTFHDSGANRDRRSVRGSERRKTPVMRLKYPLSLPADVDVDQAELRLLVRQPGTVRVYQILEGRRSLISQKALSSGWIQVDVSQAARVAAEEGHGLRLELRCNHCESPSLNVLAAPHVSARSKRAASVGRADCGKDGHRCCRHAMEVEFSQLPGMEFILQPKTFDAGFCRGRCPPRFHPAHHHALIQGLVRRWDRRRVPRPCCAPAKLQPLDILYVDEDDPSKLKVQEWSNMRVLDCACA